GTTTFVVRQITSTPIEEFFQHADSSYLNKAPALFILRPSRYPNSNLSIGGPPIAPGKFMGRGRTMPILLCDAYGFIPERMVLPPGLPTGRYDFLATLPGDPKAMLREEIRKRFGLSAHTELREEEVLILKVVDPAARGLKVSRSVEPSVF